MTLVFKRIAEILDRSNRWRGVEVAGWTAAVLMTLAVAIFSFATKKTELSNDIQVPSLLYPYLAAASVFGTTCIWILAAACIGVSDDLISKPRRHRAKIVLRRTFLFGTPLLLIFGLAGDQGSEAAWSVNWYLMRHVVGDACQSMWIKSSMPYSLLPAFGSTLAIATLLYLGTLCNGLILGAFDNKSNSRYGAVCAALRLGEAEQKLKSFLVMSSALMVTSTLALYLSFATADQIQALRETQAQTLHSHGQPPDPTANTPAAFFTIDSLSSGTLTHKQNCTMSRFKGEHAVKPASSAAYMALVTGLSFTGVLFILFTACSSALSDRAAELAREQLSIAEGSAPFNLKEWREHTGLGDSGAGTQVIQGLVLIAPAFTGLLTLVNS